MNLLLGMELQRLQDSLDSSVELRLVIFLVKFLAEEIHECRHIYKQHVLMFELCGWQHVTFAPVTACHGGAVDYGNDGCATRALKVRW